MTGYEDPLMPTATVQAGPGEVYIAPLPVCPVHGKMHFDAPRDWWTCPGWDGEGCGRAVSAEELEWQHAGTTSGVKLEYAPEGKPGISVEYWMPEPP